MLSDIGEWLRNLKQLIDNNPIDVLGVVLAGTASVGALAGWYGHKLWDRRRRTPQNPSTPPCPVDKLLEALDRGDDELWKLRHSEIPREMQALIHRSSMRVVTFANQKGGVGKTTLTANLAAYFAERGKRVLVIDLDYQGSLSSAMLKTTGRAQPFSESDQLLRGSLRAEDIVKPNRTLAPRLATVSLIPAESALNREETRLLLRWLLEVDRLDPRFSLVRTLSSDPIREAFDLVLIDTPPRLSLGTVAALAASTHVVIPVILDGGSTGTLKTFLRQLDAGFRNGLNNHLDLAGIIGTMTRQAALNDVEKVERDTAETIAQDVWGKRAGGMEAITEAVQIGWPADAYVLKTNIAVAARFREDAGSDVAYLDTSAPNRATRRLIDALGDDLTVRLRI